MNSKYIFIVIALFCSIVPAESLLQRRPGQELDKKSDKKMKLNPTENQTEASIGFSNTASEYWNHAINNVLSNQAAFIDLFFQEHQNKNSFIRVCNYHKGILCLVDLNNKEKAVKDVIAYSNQRLFLLIFSFKNNLYSVSLRGYYKKFLQQAMKSITDFIEIDWSNAYKAIEKDYGQKGNEHKVLLDYTYELFNNKKTFSLWVKELSVFEGSHRGYKKKIIENKNSLINRMILCIEHIKMKTIKKIYLPNVLMNKVLENYCKLLKKGKLKEYMRIIVYLLERKEKIAELLEFLY